MAGVARSILQVLEPPEGGVPRTVMWLAPGLLRRGWDVHVATRPDSSIRAGLEAAGVPVHLLPIAPGSRGGVAALRALRSLDAGGGFDLVHAHSSWAGAAARIALPQAQRIAYSPHCFAFLGGFSRAQRAIAWSTEQALVARTSRFALTGAWEAGVARRMLRGTRGRVRVLPGSPPPLSGAPPDPALRAFAAGEPLAGFVAALRAQKDPLALVRAAASLIAAGRLPGKMAIVGNGPLRDDVARAIERAGIGDRVRLFAFAGESEPYLRALDLVVLPSLWEAYPLVLLEAFACGTPVLATAVGGVAEMLEEGRAGGLVAPGDPRALAEALAAALLDAPRRSAWAQAGSERLAAHHGVERMLDAAEAIYEDMLRTASGRAPDAP